MKSIKEKAIEVFDNPFKQECFEAGANYVLECIEEVTNISFDEELWHTIKQLKK